ncbi:DUF7065 domain-containing protein [Sporichthya polymorpha]|uniref:DUF7065 domain-containing protein n=1 Tax=Sporichthya polymorpha TaxID=35751 RepID=UPI00036CC730|nr:hypothetical protein [Sporichthya polymorpha]
MSGTASGTAIDTEWGPLAQPLHAEVPDDPRPWRDNAFLCFWDPATRVTGVMHISASPNAAGGRRARVSVRLENTTVEVVESLGFATWNSESITFDPQTGFTVDGPGLSGSLTFTPHHALAVFLGEHAPKAFSLDSEHPLHHYQRSARVIGSLTVHGRTVEVDGFGYRDRTWGFREESASVQEYYGCMWVFPDVSVSAIRLLGQDGHTATIGHVCDANGTVPVTGMTIVRDAAGLFRSTRIDRKEGDPLEVSLVERYGTFWCPMGVEEQAGPTLSAYDEWHSLRRADGVEGFGLLEQGITRQLY